MSDSAKRHEENSNLIKEIRASIDAAIRNQEASIKTLEIQIGQMSKVLQERGFGSLPSSTETNPRDQAKSISTTIELIRTQYAVLDHLNTLDVCFDNALVDLGASVSVMPLSTYLNLGLGTLAHTRLTVELADRTMKYPKGIAENDMKVPLILGRPFLSTARAKIDVYKRKFTLRVGEEKIIFKSIKPASSLIKRVYMLSLRERMELDLEARLMGEILVLNRSLDPFLEDYIELNDLNEPFELRRNQGDDLMPTIKEGEVSLYVLYCSLVVTTDTRHSTAGDRKYWCFTDVKKYLKRYGRKEHFILPRGRISTAGTASCMFILPMAVNTASLIFEVLEDMDAYRNEGIGDIIVGEPFLIEVRIKAKRFEGIITLYNGDDEVTYQMVRSHLRFKNHTNKQCNKIPPLLKVSEKDVKNRISHAYQKLKGFYKGVLNLGPNYIRNTKTEEWLICGHSSVHETK
ncbi:hypothetical protein Tco_0591431 [Tanacetum coccineum]